MTSLQHQVRVGRGSAVRPRHRSGARTVQRARATLGVLLLALTACDWSTDNTTGGTKGIGEAPEAPAVAAEFGNYHALLIGINGYANWPPLRFAENDVREIGQLLQTDYGFAASNVTTLVGADASRERILGALREKLETLDEDDNLLVYYAGHGQLDPLTESGYWVPAEGDLYDDFTWVPFTTITDYLAGRNVRAKNVVVITDSCYGGALARSGPTPGTPLPGSDVPRYLAQLAALAAKRSRQIIASGGYEQVPDQSLFAGLLKQALRDNEYPAIDLELVFFKQIYPELRTRGQQEALMTRVVSGPELNGQFVLVRAAAAQPPALGPAQLSVESIPPGSRVLINGAARGSPPLLAELPSGNYVVRVEAAGFLPYEEELALAPGEQRTLRVQLEREREQQLPRAEIEITPRELRAGERYTLTWRTENARGAQIAGLGDVPLSGSRELIAAESTVYELVAIAADGRRTTSTSSVSVKPALPTIDYFVAKPDEIQAGQAATLAWRTDNAATVYIERFGAVPAAGLQEFQPDATTTYELVAVNELKETATRSVRIAVKPVPPPEIVSFEAEPAVIRPGDKAVLNWTARGARAAISGGVGAVPLNGSEPVAPTATTTYTLSVRNAAGAVVESAATVTVRAPTPTPPSLTLDTDRVRERPTLSNSTVLNAARVSIRSRGTLAIRQTFRADLDSGQIGAGSGDDVWFAAATATERFLQPTNGATLAAMGTNEPGLSGCTSATLGAQRLPVSRLSAGVFVCVRTNEGRFSQLKVVQPAGASPGILTVEHVTWN